MLKDLDNAFSEAEKRNYLNVEIRSMQKTESFQSPKSVEAIFSTINIKNVWSKLESQIGIKAKNIRDELGLIYRAKKQN